MFKPILGFCHRHFHTRYYGIYRHAKKLFVFDMILLATAIIMLGASLVFFFWKPSLSGFIDLGVSWGDMRLESGDQMRLVVTYANRTKFKLSPAALSVHLPPGFVIDRTRTPATYLSEQSVIDLGTITAGGKGTAEIFGTLWATPGTATPLKVYLSYQPVEEKRPPEQKTASAIINLPDTVIKTKLDIATTSLSGATVPFTYTIQNTGADKIEHIKISTNNPTLAFDTTSTDFALNPNEKRPFTGNIVVEKDLGTISFTVAVSANNNTIVQKTDTANINIISATAQSSAVIANDTRYAEPGTILPVRVNWKNTGAYEIKNAVVKLKITPENVVDTKTTARLNGLTMQGGEIVIDKNKRTLLASLKPASEDSTELNIKLLPSFSLGQKENVNMEITPVVGGEVAGLAGQNFANPGQSLKLPIPTELKLSAQTRYFTPEGDQVGRGVLPPRVGETTKYWIFVQVLNTTNEIKNARFSATLSPGVEFTGKQSVSIGPKITLDEIAQAATWGHTAIPANSITGLYFEVAVTPAATLVDHDIALIKNISFTATDKFTEKNFSLSAPNLNNQLPEDDLGYEAGYLVTE